MTLLSILAKLKNRLSTLLLIVIVVTGGALRLSLLPHSQWTGDSARDILVAKHIVLYNEHPSVGHLASGTNPTSHYPPVYYNILSLLYRLHGSAEFILFAYSLMSILSLFCVYFIARYFTSKNTSLFATLLYAFSSYYIGRQITLSSTHFALPIFLLGTYLHLRGIKTNNICALFGCFVLLLLASSITYAALITIPVFYLWTFRKNVSPNRRLFLACWIIGISFLLYGRYAAYVFINHGASALFSPLAPLNNLSFSLSSVVSQVSLVLRTMTTAFLPLPYASFLTGLLLCLLYLPFCTKGGRARASYCLSLISIALVLMTLKNKIVPPHYFYLIGPFIFIGLSISIETLWGLTTNIHSRVLVGTASVIIVYASSINTLQHYKLNYSVSTTTFLRTKGVSRLLREEVLSLQRQYQYPDTNFYAITIHTPQTQDWERTTIWFFLEEYFGKFIVVDDRSAYSLTSTNKKEVMMYICRDFGKKENRACTDPVERDPMYVFLKKKPLPSPWNNVFIYKRTHIKT